MGSAFPVLAALPVECVCKYLRVWASPPEAPPRSSPVTAAVLVAVRMSRTAAERSRALSFPLFPGPTALLLPPKDHCFAERLFSAEVSKVHLPVLFVSSSSKLFACYAREKINADFPGGKKREINSFNGKMVGLSVPRELDVGLLWGVLRARTSCVGHKGFPRPGDSNLEKGEGGDQKGTKPASRPARCRMCWASGQGTGTCHP